jgi:hypothetical protein
MWRAAIAMSVLPYLAAPWPAYAQATEAVAAVWQRFEKSCNVLFTSPEEYAAAVATEPATMSHAVNSPDGQLLAVNRGFGALVEMAQVGAVNGRAIFVCSIDHVEPQDSAALNEAFLAFVGARPGVSFTGGAVAQKYYFPDAPGAAIEAPGYWYFLTGVTPGVDSVTSFFINGGIHMAGVVQR